ncbi:MAG: hypothetical protein ACRDWG_14190 [Actinomycetes bacterium]
MPETLVLTASVEQVRAAVASGAPVLVVDDRRRPAGWLVRSRVARWPDQSALVPVGHTFRVDTDSVRAALDSAVLSPVGVAVGVDDEGTLAGVIAHDEIAEAIRPPAAEIGPV